MSRRAANRDEEIKLMVRCAQLYYDRERELSQAEVASALGINPTKVSRLLRQAQNEGVVRVTIDPPRLQRLELELMDSFGLRDAVVVPSGDHRAHDAVGRAAADYFARIAQDDISIGLAPGYSIQKLIDYLELLPFVGHRLYPLAAESTSVLRHFHPTQLASLMMTKYRDGSRVSAYTYRIPTRPSDEENLTRYQDLMKLIVADSGFRGLLEQASQADVLLTGVGAVNRPDPALQAFFDTYGISSQELIDRGAVGMINYQFFDAEGRLLTADDYPALGEIEASMISVPLSVFQQAAKAFGRSVIALAGASYKLNAVRAGLKGHYFNVLVTDVNVAEALLAVNR